MASQRPLRVAIVSPRFPPAIGGVEQHVLELSRGLVRRGVVVEVITTDPSATCPLVEERDGIVVRRFRTVANDSVFFLSPGLARWLFREADRYDLLHAHSYHTPLALTAAVAARRHRIPLVFTPHYHGTGHSPLRALLHRPYRPFGARVVHGAQAIVCVSAAERVLLIKDFAVARRVTVIPNGVDLNEIRAATRQPRKAGSVVLAVGRLERYKRLDALIAATASLPPDHRLVVVGDGPDRSRLEALARELGIADRVELTGQIAEGALHGWLQSADVLATLSTVEAFGLTLLEGAAAGARIVASDIPAHREVAGYLPPDAVRFVSPKAGPVEIATTIEAAVKSSVDADAVAAMVPSWDDMASRVLQLYSRCLDRPRGSGASTRSLILGRA
jgi:glycosyltransferase involved in cell wall biosynthesis